jgi:RNA polymerase sigma-70 factor (ECF subfamily)
MTNTAHGEVLRLAAGGDDEALAVLVRAYHDRVYRFGLRVCHDAFDAEDAVQEAFLQLARRPDVTRDPSALSWLMSVVRNACLRMLRPFARTRRSLGERVEEATVASREPDPDQVLERWQLVEQVHCAIGSLPLAYREVLVLRDLEGLSAEEVSKVLGIEVPALKSRLHRARSQLREELKRLVGAPGGRRVRVS